MKKILVLGSSVAGVKAIEKIRSTDKESEIILLAVDGHLPYNRDLFTKLLTQDIPENQVFYRSQSFFDDQRVHVILDKTVTRINFKKNKVYTEDKTQISFDSIIITELPQQKLPNIKGVNKTGVFGFTKLNDALAIAKDLYTIETLAIQSSTFEGFAVAAAAAKKGREVLLVSKANAFSSIDDPIAAQWLTDLLAQRNVNVVFDNEIGEILGDQEVKAVKLKSGKVFATEMVVFTQTFEDQRVVADTGLECEDRILVDASFKTNFDHVFAVDNAAAFKGDNLPEESYLTCQTLEQEGSVVGAKLLGEQAQSQCAPEIYSVNIDDISIILMGRAKTAEGLKIIELFDREAKTYRKIVADNNILVGAVLINQPDQKHKYWAMIQQGADISALEESLSQPAADAGEISAES